MVEYIRMRVTIPSGGSHKVTIPAEVLRGKWRKEPKGAGFPVCFLQEDGKVILETPERVLGSRLYPREVLERVREDYIRYQKNAIANRYERIIRNLVVGRVSELDFKREFGFFLSFAEGLSRECVKAFNTRELHFIQASQIDQLITSIMLEYEKDREEYFTGLLDEVKRIRDDAEDLRGLLSKLESGFKEGRISEVVYRRLREMLLGRLTLAESRLDRLRDVLKE